MFAKKSTLLALTLVLAVSALWIGGPSAEAASPRQDAPAARTITVTGYGVAYGAPDIVTLGLGVESINADVKAAMDDTNTRMNAVMQVLLNTGIAAEDIRTDYFSIWQDYYGPGGEQPQPSYRVSTSVIVTVREVEKVSDLLGIAVDAGANLVNSIQFNIENRDALQAEARALAVEDAQARAAHLAGLMGLSVGEPLTITEGGDFYGPMYGGGGGGGGYGGEGAAISQGQLQVSLSVMITFVLIPAS